MTNERKAISVRGKIAHVPTVEVGGRTVVVTGRFLRIARIHDSGFVEGQDIEDPGEFLAQLRRSGIAADVLTFAQRIGQETPKYPYRFDWDNAAVASTVSYDQWWSGLPQVVRKNVRRAAKRGVSVRVATFDDRLIQGIKAIYDEAPVRQGRRFWHFGKDLATVRADNSSYLDRSDFIGAYCDDELIGFMKCVYVNDTAVVMQILTKASHNDKRPMNALIAKAVEVCHQKGCVRLVYSKFTYGKKKQSDIAEFKRRNGFVQANFPKYYVPLTLKGRLGLALGMHRGVVELLPSGIINVLLSVRSRVLERNSRDGAAAQETTMKSIAAEEGTETL
jgi:hypothetical protein